MLYHDNRNNKQTRKQTNNYNKHKTKKLNRLPGLLCKKAQAAPPELAPAPWAWSSSWSLLLGWVFPISGRDCENCVEDTQEDPLRPKPGGEGLLLPLQHFLGLRYPKEDWREMGSQVQVAGAPAPVLTSSGDSSHQGLCSPAWPWTLCVGEANWVPSAGIIGIHCYPRLATRFMVEAVRG